MPKNLNFHYCLDISAIPHKWYYLIEEDQTKLIIKQSKAHYDSANEAKEGIELFIQETKQ